MARTVLKWSSGVLEFDAVLQEQPEHRARVTDYPVELGANLADHVFVEPVRMRMRVVVSNDPARPKSQLSHIDVAEERGVQITVTQPLIPGADRAGLPTSVAGIGLNYETSVRAAVRTFAGKVQRIQNVYAELRTALSQVRLFTIVTDVNDFDNMILEEILPERVGGAGRSMRLGLTFRQLLTSELAQRADLALLRSLTTRDARSQPPKDSGRKTTSAADEETGRRASVLKDLFD